MKKLIFLLLFTGCLFTSFVNNATAQTTLAAGDISFVGFNSALGSRDGFSFVPWVNLSTGTVIKFTDDGFNSASNSNTAGNVRALEQIITWTATSAIAAGTVITIEGDGVSTTVASTGTFTVTNSDGVATALMNLANSGDNFFAFQGSFTTNNSATGTISGTPLFLVQYQGIGSNTGFLTTGATTTNNSYIPSDLVGYTLFLGGNAVAAEYTGPRSGGNVAVYKAAVNNPANWTTYVNPNGVNSYNTTAFLLGAPPSITGQPSGKTVCAGSGTSFSVTASNASSYQWQVNTGAGFSDLTNTAPYSNVTTANLSITAATTAMNGYSYRCNVTNAQGATTSNAASLTVTTITAGTSQTNIACNGGATGAAGVSPSGGAAPYTYSWSPSGGTGAIATSLAAGAYTCTITDANSCTITKNFTITQPSAITATTSQTNVACNGGSNGSASVSVSGGAGAYTYSWSPTGGTAATATGLVAGAYTCTITDANSCTITKNFTITQPTAITASTSQTNVACNGGSNGSASVSVSGGAGAYTYSWSPTGGTAATATGLAAGAYTCTITDANSCTITKNFTITQPSAITATKSQTNVACNGGSNGSATVLASGGTGPFTYSWSPSGGTAATATGLSAGVYSCTITDANSCTITKNFTITQPTAISASTSQTNVACNGGSNGSASVSVSGGAGAYTYSWSPTGGTAATATGLVAGAYTCTITDANSCTITKNFTITQPTAISASTSQTNVACNGGSNGSASVSASGGAGAYTYSWSPSGGTAATATGLAAGAYTCTITDANSCTVVKSFTITQADFIAGSTAYTLPATNQAVTKPVTTGNYVSGACELISTVAASGAHPVSGNATSKVWIESTVPATGGNAFVQRHYEITPAVNATTSTGTITLYFSQSDFDNFNAQSAVHLPSGPLDAVGKANLLISKYSGISDDGSGLPASYSSSAVTIDPLDDKIVWNATAAAWEITFDVDGFSGFIVQAVSSPLPVSWASFTVQQEGDAALLRWSTASEQNTRSFTVLHSINGSAWNSIANIHAAGLSTSAHDYSYLHATPASGVNYYRISQTDVDGRSVYSDIKTLKLNSQNPAFSVIVNPVANGTMKINAQQKITLSLFSPDGKMLWKKQLMPGMQTLDVSRYAKGIYLLKADGIAKRIVIQ